MGKIFEKEVKVGEDHKVTIELPEVPANTTVKVVVDNINPTNESRKRKRPAGLAEGEVVIHDSFYDPLPEEELRLWEGQGDE